ncbi:hypothetical protein BTVI_105516 [Pitangus sulphuratus]|nr:hypothetical protein BTVI_105516 [Pitangus sulphuratus]
MENEEVEHNCLDIIDYQTKIQEYLMDIPIEVGVHLFTDGSSKGKWKSGYAVVDGEDLTVMESGSLPNTWSTQVCKVYAVISALLIIGSGVGTIYTDSKYAWGVAHFFGKIWHERGMVTSQGKDLSHLELLETLLEEIQWPQEIAIVHVKGHRKGNNIICQGNNGADQAAREATLSHKVPKAKIMALVLIPKEIPQPVFTDKEEQELLEIGIKKNVNGEWFFLDGRQMLSEAIT